MVMFANLTVLGMQFKAISWAMGYVYLAKGKGQLFLALEVISGVVILALNLIFYYFFELNGLGISFILSYLFGMTLSYLVLKKKFGFGLPAGFYRKSVINFGFMALCFITVFIKTDILRYISGGVVLIIAASYSLFHLNDLMDLKSYFRERLKK
jgi:O-antigen/teichoic acid export membrane protein